LASRRGPAAFDVAIPDRDLDR